MFQKFLRMLLLDHRPRWLQPHHICVSHPRRSAKAVDSPRRRGRPKTKVRQVSEKMLLPSHTVASEPYQTNWTWEAPTGWSLVPHFGMALLRSPGSPLTPEAPDPNYAQPHRAHCGPGRPRRRGFPGGVGGSGKPARTDLPRLQLSTSPVPPRVHYANCFILDPDLRDAPICKPVCKNWVIGC